MAANTYPEISIFERAPYVRRLPCTAFLFLRVGLAECAEHAGAFSFKTDGLLAARTSHANRLPVSPITYEGAFCEDGCDAWNQSLRIGLRILGEAYGLDLTKRLVFDRWSLRVFTCHASAVNLLRMLMKREARCAPFFDRGSQHEANLLKAELGHFCSVSAVMVHPEEVAEILGRSEIPGELSRRFGI